MNILFLTQVLPYPLDAGPKVRAYYTLRHLAQNHSVTLVSFVRPGDTPEAQAHLRSMLARLVTCPISRSALAEAMAIGRSLLNGEPLLITRDRVPAMHSTLRALVAGGSYDIIHADQLWMAPYALAARAAIKPGRAGPRLVLDQHNAVHLIPSRLAAAAGNPIMRLGWQRETRQMARYEATTCRAFDRVVAVTEADRQALNRLYPADRPLPITVIPICIDPAGIRRQPRPEDSPGLLFLGGMHWPPNADGAHWFALTILPAVLAQQPRARFLAVGKQPPRTLLRPAAGSIEAPGYVDDPQPYWDRSQAFVVPLRAGGGMRVKILEAWARGVPVVATTIGAEGITYRAGENILIADTPQEFAECVLAILRDPALAEQLSLAGRAAVEQHYDWRQTYAAWEAVYAAQ